MSYEADKFEHAGLTVRIVADEDPTSPREWDNLGWMICWHRRYYLGDRRDGQRHPETHDGTVCESPGEFEEWWEQNGNGGILLPLYLYDHSGITMNTTGFSCPWDSGQVGYVYATREQLVNEYGKRLTKQRLDRARKVLVGEVETYDQFLTGDVYGFIVEDDDGNELDSCWGHYGLDYAKECGRDAAAAIAPKLAVGGVV